MTPFSSLMKLILGQISNNKPAVQTLQNSGKDLVTNRQFARFDPRLHAK